MAKKTGSKGGGGGRKSPGAVREQAAVVRRYLEALQKHKPKRGRKRTPESIKKRINAIESRLAEASALQRLQLVQERMDLETELESLKAKENLQELEAGFVAVAKEYGEHKGISYAAWRELGVPAEILRKAQVPRTRRTTAARKGT